MSYLSFRNRFSRSRQIATFMKRAIVEESITFSGEAKIENANGEKVSQIADTGLDSASAIQLITSTATSISDVRTISLDSSEVLTLIDSSYVQARIGAVSTTFDNDASDNIWSYQSASAFSAGVTGADNIAIGNLTLSALTSGNRNVAIGKSAGTSITGGSGNIVVGNASYTHSNSANSTNGVYIGQSAAQNGYGTSAIAIGNSAMYNGQNKSHSINIGDGAGANAAADYRICIGYRTGYTGSSGTGSISIGYNAGYNTSNNYNIGIGYQAGYAGSGAYNTSIGYTAGSTVNGNYNVLLGYNAEPTGTSSSNQCIIGARSSTGMISYLQVGSYMTMNSGTLTMSGNVTAYSDARLKTNVETVFGLDKVTQMRGVTFEKDGQQGTGVIAQEMLEVAPELVHEEHDYYSVNYSGLSGYFIEAIKEQQKQIEELKAEIKKLKGE